VRITPLAERALVRLIPATYHKPPVLRGLTDTDTEAAILADLEGLTSDRLRAERGKLAALDRRELAWARRANDLAVYGVTHINAAFAYTRTGGNRFNSAERGAWYCAWDSLTALAEVGYHRSRELGFSGRFTDRARYAELLADFIGEVPDLTDTPDHPALHADPAIGYPPGQALADALRRDGYSGLIYPSVRRAAGKCLVVFEPNAIRNVRPAASWELVWNGTPEFSIHAVQ
jgi:RES domain-containing protein